MSDHLTPNTNPPNTLIPKNHWFRFTLHFFAGTVLAIGLSIFPVVILAELLVVLLWFDVLLFLTGSTIYGAFTGVLQGLILQRYLAKGYWILATVVGYQITGLLLFGLPLLLHELLPDDPDLSMLAAIFYALSFQGLFQWLILRRVVRDAWIWLLTYPLPSLLVAPVIVFTEWEQTGFTLAALLYLALLPLLQAAVFCTFYQKNSQAT